MLCGASLLCKLCFSRLISVTLIIASKVDNIIIVSRWSKLICWIIKIISAELCYVVWDGGGNFMCCADYNEVEFMSGTNAGITIKMSPYNL